MVARLLLWLAVAVLAALPAVAADTGSTSLGSPLAKDKPGRAIIERIAWETYEGRARLVVGVRGAVNYTTHAAGADPATNMPHRAYVDLRPAVLGKDVPRVPLGVEDGLAQRVRVGQYDPETVRIVVELSAPGLFEVRTSEKPPRLLLGIAPRGPRVAAVQAARAAEAAPVTVPPSPSPAAHAALPSEEPRASASPQVVARLAEPTVEPIETRAPLPAATTAPTALPTVLPAASPAPPRESVAGLLPTARMEPPAVVAEAPARPRADAAPVPVPVPAAEPEQVPDRLAAQPAETASPAPEPRRSPAQKAAAKAQRPQATARVWTVVLDPGHGGRDPGARGVTGDEEKDITLAVSRMVAERLGEDPQIRTVLTRTDDGYVSLEQRTAIANAQGADLFISIHANASENPQLAGVETYTLNNTDDRATIRLAALENGLALTGAAPGERDLAYILSDLVQTGKEDESVTLARAVQGNLVSYLRERWRGVANLGVKKGPFYVLVGAYMPCILVEMAFLTNETEGQRIAARRYQLDAADGIALGIRRFLASDTANANL